MFYSFFTPVLLGACLSVTSPVSTTPVKDFGYKTSGYTTVDLTAKPVLAGKWRADGIYGSGSRKYYVSGNRTVKNQWIYHKGAVYYACASGALIHGWFTQNGKTYYFDEDGIRKDGWLLLDKDWYYFDRDGMATGWKMIPSGGEEKWYCFHQESGRMYVDDTTPDGYFVDSDGVWIEKLDIPRSDAVFSWEKHSGDKPSPISGLQIAGMPVEFYMLSIAGETSGGSNLQAIANGDRGRAYGFCQFDYRYDLPGFMRYAYKRHPELWGGFEEYLNKEKGDPVLVGNRRIGETFLRAVSLNKEAAVTDQLSYIRKLYWDGFADKMNRAGYRLNERHIAVSAALLSVNVNCGPQAVLFMNTLNPEMSDEEMLTEIYRVRNTVMSQQLVGTVRKGTTKRYLQSEPEMAFDLYHGYVTVDSSRNYGGGVEWHGNPFARGISTAEIDRVLPEEMGFEPEEEDLLLADSAAEDSSTPDSVPSVEQGEGSVAGETSESEEVSRVIVAGSRKADRDVEEEMESEDVSVMSSPVLLAGRERED